MELADLLLESWDRQSRIVQLVAERINQSNRDAKPSADGWPISYHLAHIHKVRQFHLIQLDPERAAKLGESFLNEWEDPIDDLGAIKTLLNESATAVHEAIRDALLAGKARNSAYDHPVFLLQHLVWHEGWHVALIFLALRLVGQEPPEEWEEKHVWGQWRND